MGSQRFCLRWNNHQTNLLSVFDQLLHDEAFVDVTLAVEGQFLRAHKMVLSACSPYFQALFVGHPDKHPIVILKDVPYSDMRSLLDFMYRGEVSVDQERLTAFLKVAESLRIKGLTEVNEERCDLPSIANSLLNQTLPPPPPPPSLHRLPMPPTTQPKRPLPPNPMLNSALTAPKRKRGRPRKLSGSSPNPPLLPHPDLEHEDQKPLQASAIENHIGVGPPSFSQIPLQQHHTLQANSLPLPDIPVASFRSCLGPVVPPPGVSQPCNTPLQPASNLPNPPPTEEPESPKIEDDEEDDCDEVVQKIEDCDDDGIMEEDEPPDPQHRKVDDPKPSTSGQDSLASFQSSTQSDGDRFSSSGQKAEQSSGFVEIDDSSNITASFDDLIACSPASSDVEENVEAEFSSHTVEPEFADDDISQFEEDSLRSLIGRLPDTDGNRRRMDKMSIRKFCSREGDQVHRCTICSKAYTHISNFCRHFLSAHCGTKQEVHCPICNKPFTRKDNMMTHAKQVHGLSCLRGMVTEQLPNYDQQQTD